MANSDEPAAGFSIPPPPPPPIDANRSLMPVASSAFPSSSSGGASPGIVLRFRNLNIASPLGWWCGVAGLDQLITAALEARSRQSAGRKLIIAGAGAGAGTPGSDEAEPPQADMSPRASRVQQLGITPTYHGITIRPGTAADASGAEYSMTQSGFTGARVQCPRCDQQVYDWDLASHETSHSSEIIPGFLYLGGERNARNEKEMTSRLNISHVINVAWEVGELVSGAAPCRLLTLSNAAACSCCRR